MSNAERVLHNHFHKIPQKLPVFNIHIAIHKKVCVCNSQYIVCIIKIAISLIRLSLSIN